MQKIGVDESNPFADDLLEDDDDADDGVEKQSTNIQHKNRRLVLKTKTGKKARAAPPRPNTAPARRPLAPSSPLTKPSSPSNTTPTSPAQETPCSVRKRIAPKAPPQRPASASPALDSKSSIRRSLKKRPAPRPPQVLSTASSKTPTEATDDGEYAVPSKPPRRDSSKPISGLTAGVEYANVVFENGICSKINGNDRETESKEVEGHESSGFKGEIVLGSVCVTKVISADEESNIGVEETDGDDDSLVVEESKVAEPEGAEPTVADQEDAESKFAEPKFADQEDVESEDAEPKVADQEDAESEDAEPEDAEPKVADQEDVESENADPEVADPEVIEESRDIVQKVEGDVVETVTSIVDGVEAIARTEKSAPGTDDVDPREGETLHSIELSKDDGLGEEVEADEDALITDNGEREDDDQNDAMTSDIGKVSEDDEESDTIADDNEKSESSVQSLEEPPKSPKESLHIHSTSLTPTTSKRRAPVRPPPPARSDSLNETEVSKKIIF